MSLSNIFKFVLFVCNFLVLTTCPFSLSFWYITSYEVTFACGSHDIVILSSCRLVHVSTVLIVGMFISGAGTSLYTLFKNSILAISEIVLLPLLAVTFIDICFTATWLPKSITTSSDAPLLWRLFSLNSTVSTFPSTSVYVIYPCDGRPASALPFSEPFITTDSISMPSLLCALSTLFFEVSNIISIVNGASALGACPSAFSKLTTVSELVKISLIFSAPFKPLVFISMFSGSNIFSKSTISTLPLTLPMFSLT